MFEFDDPTEFDDVEIFDSPARRAISPRALALQAALGRVMRNPRVFQARWSPDSWEGTACEAGWLLCWFFGK